METTVTQMTSFIVSRNTSKQTEYFHCVLVTVWLWNLESLIQLCNQYSYLPLFVVLCDDAQVVKNELL